jgi:NAD(P)-dependent dehydrogenase (short-subunit alcohol dehydrogenase family)
MSSLRFDGRVAVVTGGARGIGAAYASLLASRGARVIVNDTGTSRFGSGIDASPASEQAGQIRQAGGIAEPDTSDVSDPEGARDLIGHAVSAFGRLDIVVSNAGIYWTDSFPEIDPADLQRQLAVHVGGSFNVARAAWPHLRACGSGRVVMTTSTGALGAAELVSYGTAKAAVLGLGRALAMAGKPHGIKVNIVAPMAMTRMMNARSDDPGVPDDPERDPSLVAPLVVILCHRGCPVSGEAYMSGMRRTARLFIAETEGYTHPSADLAPEELLAHWDEISDVSRQRLMPDTRTWGASNRERIAAVKAGRPHVHSPLEVDDGNEVRSGG